VQERLPETVLRKVIGDPFGNQNVTSIATIHHSLRHIDPRARHTNSLVHILDRIDRAAVHAHAQTKVWMSFQCAADFQPALRRFLGTLKEDQRHAIAGRNANQLAVSIAPLKLRCLPHDLIEFVYDLALLVDEEFGITDYVHEQNVRNREMRVRFHFNSHLRLDSVAAK